MAMKLKVDESVICMVGGGRSEIYTFRCPRCQNPIIFFEYERCPISCKCGKILDNIKNIYNYVGSRIRWHFFKSEE